MSKYARRAAGERALLQSLFADEQDEKRGGYFGVEFGRKRQRDDGAGRDRVAVRPDHVVNARLNRLKARGFSGTDRNFGVPDSYVGRRHAEQMATAAMRHASHGGKRSGNSP
jgi:hypothetical protein